MNRNVFLNCVILIKIKLCHHCATIDKNEELVAVKNKENTKKNIICQHILNIMRICCKKFFISFIIG